MPTSLSIQPAWRRGARGLLPIAFLALALPATAQHHDAHDPRALAEDPREAEGQLAPVLAGLGEHHRPVTTRSERAQLFFDQGLKLTYGFNHQEALRSFKEGARLDPECAMCYWGWALVLGPNLNMPMDPELEPQAREAIELALEHKGGKTPVEQALIEALAERHGGDGAERATRDLAYAEAMAEVYRRFPDDTDVATLYAAAVMNLSPWNYWTPDGHPRARTGEVLEALEGALAHDPHHEGALHYYIHAVEAVDPKRGEAAADALRGLAPGAGHLTHMPSHIYMQLGRYADAFEDNARAAEADEAYLTQCMTQGIYPLGYYPHNVHFQAWAAFMQGRRAESMRLARKVASKVPGDHHGNDWGLYQTFLSFPLYAMVRFGDWQGVLAESEPPSEQALWNGVWHYARGLAHLHGGEGRKARRELRTLERLADDPAAAEQFVGFSDAGTLLTIATETLAGEIAAARGRYEEALGHLERAVRLEDGLLYNEPPDWPFPARHALGAVLLEAGRPREAAVVYQRDLEENPGNGYALFGLHRSLEAQGRSAEAKEIGQRFDKAWAEADVTLKTSRF